MNDLLPFVVVGLTAGSVYGLAASGLVLTYKTSGIFNFAHGTIAALSAYVFYDLREKQGLPWPFALAICLLVVSPIIGLLMERIARQVADAPVATKVVATIGLIVGVQQAITIRYGAVTLQSEPFLPTGQFTVAGVNVGVDQLLVMLIALGGMVGLTAFLRTRAGRQMRAVVDQPDLLALTGTSPASVRRTAWMIGTTFAGLSGVLLAPTLGLNVTVLTLLVVQAFGAAAVGMFTNIPLSYVGGIAIGIIAALSTKYVADVTWLIGLPPSIPFLVLFVVLVAAPSRWLVDFTTERRPPLRVPRRLGPNVKLFGGIALVVLALRAPDIAGTRLPAYTTGLAYVIIFLSLAVLIRTSGQVSLAQLSFAAVGSVASARLAVEAGLPWIVAVFAGALAAVPVGAVLAIPAIRRSGLYLALATFGFAVLLERLVFSTSLMYGSTVTSLVAPRPSLALGDRAYFYVVLAFAVGACALVVGLRRSRLGRLLTAMADSPTALSTGGASVTRIKVVVFCLAAFLAGLGGALVGPVTGNASSGEFSAFASLFLIVFSVVIGGSEVRSSIGAAAAYVVLPAYSSGDGSSELTTMLFGLLAVGVAMSHAGIRVPARVVRRATARRTRSERSPLLARIPAATASELR